MARKSISSSGRAKLDFEAMISDKPFVQVAPSGTTLSKGDKFTWEEPEVPRLGRRCGDR